MAQQYWVKPSAEGEVSGPYTAGQIRKMAMAGRLLPATLVSPDGTTWNAARRIKGLFATAAPAAVAAAHARPAHAPPPIHAPVMASETAVAPPAAAMPAPLPPDPPMPMHAVEPRIAAPAGAVATIDYRTSNTSLTTADDRFRGMMLFLYILAIVFGLLGIIGSVMEILAAARKVYGARTPDYTLLVVASGYALAYLVVLAAGILGCAKFKAERTLVLGGMILIGVQLVDFALAGYTLKWRSADPSYLEPIVWLRGIRQGILVVQGLTCALLFIAGASALRSERANPRPRSPWAPLARAIATIAILWAILGLVMYGGYKYEYRFAIRSGMAAAPFQWQMLLPYGALGWTSLIAEVVLLIGGLFTLALALSGRILVLVATLTIATVIVIGFEQRYSAMYSARLKPDPQYLAEQGLAMGRALLFFLLAAIVLLRPLKPATSHVA